MSEIEIPSTFKPIQHGKIVLGANESSPKNLTKDTEIHSSKDEQLGKTKKLFVWFWRHPFTRLFTAISIMALNFLIYAIDPVAESSRDVELLIVGSLWSIVTTEWTGKAQWLAVRAFVCLVAFIGGPVIGWYIVHRKILKGYFRLKIFGYYNEKEKRRIPEDDRDEYKGSWFTMSITTLFFGWASVLIYNVLVPNEYKVDDWLGFSEYLFGQIAVSLSWVGDWFTFFMILDSMLQAKNRNDYLLLDHLQDEWLNNCGGYFRIVVVWTCFVIGSFIVVFAVWVRHDSLFETWRLESGITTFRSSRAIIAALIFSLDLCTVTQDWDFPSFRNTEQIKITGFNFHEVSFPPKCIKRMLPSNLTFKINGKWLNYTPMVLVMGLDMAAFLAIATYEPGEFGQYIGPDKKIWNVADYDEANQLGMQFDITRTYDLLNYTARAGKCIDIEEEWCMDFTICNWNDEPGYCTYGKDVKLAGSFENRETWWSGTPIVLSVVELVWSLNFMRSLSAEYQVCSSINILSTTL